MLPRMLLLTAAVLVVCHLPALAADDRLTVTQDESSMERTIARYLEGAYGVEAEERMLGEDDLALAVAMDGESSEGFNAMIDTEPSAKEEDGTTVLERVVTVQVLTGVRVPQERRRGVLEAINRYVAGNWFTAVYIDPGNEVVCQWSVNVMKEGLPTDYVADAIIRTADAWRRLRPEVEAELDGEG